MRRRKFIALVGSAAAACPLRARAQQPTLPVVGYLGIRSAESDVPMLNAFRRGLNETGYVEGKNVVIEFRFAGAQYDRLAADDAALIRGGNLDAEARERIGRGIAALNRQDRAAGAWGHGRSRPAVVLQRSQVRVGGRERHAGHPRRGVVPILPYVWAGGGNGRRSERIVVIQIADSAGWVSSE